MNTARSQRLTYRQRPKMPVKNVPLLARPIKPELVFIYDDEEIHFDKMHDYASNDNDC